MWVNKDGSEHETVRISRWALQCSSKLQHSRMARIRWEKARPQRRATVRFSHGNPRPHETVCSTSSPVSLSLDLRRLAFQQRFFPHLRVDGRHPLCRWITQPVTRSALSESVSGGNGWDEAGRSLSDITASRVTVRITTSGSLGFERGAYPAVRGTTSCHGESSALFLFRIGGTHSGVTVQDHRTAWWSPQLSPEVAVRLFLSVVEWWIRLVACGSRLLFRISFGILIVLSSDASAEEFQNLSDLAVLNVVTARFSKSVIEVNLLRSSGCVRFVFFLGRCFEGHNQRPCTARRLVKFVVTVSNAVCSGMRLGLRRSVGTRLLKYEAIDILTHISVAQSLDW